MTAKRIAGITEVSIDGTAYDIVGDLTYSTAAVSRETLIGLNGVHGVKELPVVGFISFQMRDSSGFVAGDFMSLVDATVQIQLANGKQVIGAGMWAVTAPEVDASEGTFTLKFEGTNVVEITS